MFVTIRESGDFERDAPSLLTAAQLDDFKLELAGNPTRGDLIQGTGGCRKIRVGAKGKGKSGGARVIYYYHSEDYPLGLIAIFGKGEKANILAAEKRELKQMTARYIDAFRRKAQR